MGGRDSGRWARALWVQGFITGDLRGDLDSGTYTEYTCLIGQV